MRTFDQRHLLASIKTRIMVTADLGLMKYRDLSHGQADTSASTLAVQQQYSSQGPALQFGCGIDHMYTTQA